MLIFLQNPPPPPVTKNSGKFYDHEEIFFCRMRFTIIRRCLPGNVFPGQQSWWPIFG